MSDRQIGKQTANICRTTVLGTWDKARVTVTQCSSPQGCLCGLRDLAWITGSIAFQIYLMP